MTQSKNGMNDFNLDFAVDAPAKDVAKAISQVNAWWAKNFKGRASKLNDEFSVTFGETFVDFRVSEIVGDEKVVWKVTDCNLHWIEGKKEWKGTEVIWVLKERNGKTQIDFTHKGLTPRCECFENCEEGWTHHLKDSLVKLIEEGKGFPE
jgi:hypothetical protein